MLTENIHACEYNILTEDFITTKTRSLTEDIGTENEIT